jgi:hypothetical protein
MSQRKISRVSATEIYIIEHEAMMQITKILRVA